MADIIILDAKERKAKKVSKPKEPQFLECEDCGDTLFFMYDNGEVQCGHCGLIQGGYE